ncbi:MAG: hypothetical protein CMK07_12490 [Ponticaulis sp.]|nr:hypothetical protein [Ponticaulis sp.]
MTNFYGTVADNTFNGDDGYDYFYDDQGGDDIYNAAGGNDYLYWRRDADNAAATSLEAYGEDGDDDFYVYWYNGAGAIDALLNGGGGNDEFFVYQGNYYGNNPGNLVTVKAGAGNDFLELYMGADYRIWLGGGQDIVKLFNQGDNFDRIIFNDFETGAGGDVIRMDFFLSRYLDGWNGNVNPFGVGPGFLNIRQDGADTIVELDRDGGGNSFVDFMVFKNTDVGDITTDNFYGIDPSGAALSGIIQNGTSDRDEMEGTTRGDTLRGLDGNDNIRDANGGDDSIFGGNGADYILVERGDWIPLDSTVELNGQNDGDSIYGYWYGGGGLDLTIDAGNGNDYVRVEYYQHETNAHNALDIDLGSGDDRLRLMHNSLTTITLGDGQDEVEIASNVTGDLERIIFSDFDPGTVASGVGTQGTDGDYIIWEDFLLNYLVGWDGVVNPFDESADFLWLHQSGADTVLKIDVDGGGDSWEVFMVFQNTTASDFTGDNFDGIDPDGTPLIGLDYTGTDGNNYIEGTARDDIVRLLDGNDTYYDYVGGNDTAYGGLGDDQLNFRRYADNVRDSVIFASGASGMDGFDLYWYGGAAVDATFEGGGDDDDFYIWFDQNVMNADNLVEIDAGGGDDHIFLRYNSAVRLTLGPGQDHVQYDQNMTGDLEIVTYYDFETGASGDTIDFFYLLYNVLEDWNGQGNPFDEDEGFMRLRQNGANTVMQMDYDGGGDDYQTIAVFRDTTLGDFTSENFSGIDPDGVGMPDPLDIRGGDAIDYLYGYGLGDQLRGLGGNDVIQDARGGDDRLYGGDGDDTITATRYDYHDIQNTIQMFGQEGDDYLRMDWNGGAAPIVTMNGGNGNDEINIDYDQNVTAPGGAVTVIAGEGDDIVYARHNTQVTMTLGAGQDWVELDQYLSGNIERILINDLDPGSTGDVISFESFLSSYLIGWDNEINPFDPSAGFLSMVETATSVIIKMDQDGGGDDYRNLFVLRNVTAAQLTADNFDGIDPHGGPLPGLDYYGTENADTVYGTGRSDTIRGLGGNDYIQDYNGGDDNFLGGDGDDRIYARRNFDDAASTVMLQGQNDDDYLSFNWYGGNAIELIMNGGTGNDELYLYFYQNYDIAESSITIDLGSGDDFVTMNWDAQVNLTLGSGQDTILFDNYFYGTVERIIVEDFDPGTVTAAGTDGDVFMMDEMLFDYLDGWNGNVNPFGAGPGFLSLVQSGTNVTLRMDQDGGGDSWEILAVFRNATLADFTAENFYGLDPTGGALSGVDLTGTVDRDEFRGTARDDIMRGLAGNDYIVDYTSGSDTIFGGDGGDTIDIYRGSSSVLQSDLDLNGQDGNDNIYIDDYSSGNVNADVDAGADDDYVAFYQSQSTVSSSGTFDFDLGSGDDFLFLSHNTTGVTITTGTGVDEVRFNPYMNYTIETVTITDFTTGAGGDLVNIDYLISNYIDGYDGVTNPFDAAAGYFELVQSGSDVILRIDEDGGADGFTDLVVFENTTLGNFIAENFNGLDPTGVSSVGGANTVDANGKLIADVEPDALAAFFGEEDSPLIPTMDLAHADAFGLMG